MKEDYGYHISVVQEIEDIVVQEILMERYILILEIMEDLIITVKNILASVFSDKIGCRDNNLYDGGYYYADYLKITLKKILKLLEDYHSDRN